MPHRRTNLTTFHHASELRHETTDAERILWRALRSGPFEAAHFRRQHAVGPYIVDFCAPRQKLVVELDGGQHLEQEDYDAKRTTYLESQGFKVLRFWNNEVTKNLGAVVRAIEVELKPDGW